VVRTAAALRIVIRAKKPSTMGAPLQEISGEEPISRKQHGARRNCLWGGRSVQGENQYSVSAHSGGNTHGRTRTVPLGNVDRGRGMVDSAPSQAGNASTPTDARTARG